MKRMITLAIAIIVALPVIMSAKTITITKTNGGSSGYYSVSETHDSGGWFGGEEHSLSCIDPGSSSCTWTVNPGSLRIMFAEGEIANGHLSGSDVQVIGNLRVTVTWNATNSYNCTITEVQEQL